MVPQTNEPKINVMCKLSILDMNYDNKGLISVT